MKKSRGYFQVKEMWTHDFFCLATTSAVSIPRHPQKMIFPSKGSFVNVKEKLESLHSKLKDGSGFELLRSNLALINTLAGGYSVPFLRDAVARHWPISGHSKWTWTRQWLKVLSILSSYVFRTAATNKISWTVQPKPTCKNVNWLSCGEVEAFPIMTYTAQSPFQALGI